MAPFCPKERLAAALEEQAYQAEAPAAKSLHLGGCEAQNTQHTISQRSLIVIVLQLF